MSLLYIITFFWPFHICFNNEIQQLEYLLPKDSHGNRRQLSKPLESDLVRIAVTLLASLSIVPINSVMLLDIILKKV